MPVLDVQHIEKHFGSTRVLEDISFSLDQGQALAIIGSSGSGKTTLLSIAVGLQKPDRGQVTWSGRYSYVPQHNALAEDLTVRDNLRWGKEDATQEEIEEACHIACVDEFIDRLEKGYDTEMGQGGVNVSGGQKQRLCIARAILKSPKVLILDDSTSAVDTATEAKIRQGLAEKLPDMTKIIIAQRISSVRHADQIVILDNGRIDQVGTHEELLASNRIYQEIYHSQQEGGLL